MNTEQRNKFVIRTFLKEYLDLRKDKDNELATVDSIRKGVEFKGANLWILIFAIFMASLGLNVNSTAVIIGAMLISPLMGPIMGIGLSVGLNDFELMKRSFKSFLITTAFSVATSTIFFLFTPIAEAQSELLARTSPSIYDVFYSLVWWTSRSGSSFHERKRECNSRCRYCYCFDASTLYSWLWFSFRKSCLFSWCFLFILHQLCVY